MTHTNTEIFYIRHNNKTIYCTQEFLNLNNIPMRSREAKLAGAKLMACNAPHFSAPYTYLYDGLEKRKIFIYGTSMWFDTEKERDEYRIQAQKEREQFLEWNRIKKAIIEKLDDKTQEELEQILASL
jgi:hypothetical protein